ncbi:MAG TPA: methyltransferase, partial [Candidatus Dormibacteraeota bacterium]|nr:methyltransferase [Candidatus Dormibacteraeota bacterium]
MAVAAADPVEAMVGRLFMESLGAMHQSTVYIGVKFGLFSALAEPGQLTAAELATRCGLDEWYVREWLQAETTAGLVRADSDDLRTARFCLAEGVHETLVDETNPAFIGGLAYAAGAVANAMPALLEAYRTGAGVPMSAYGPEVVSAQAMINRPVFVNSLVAEFLPGIPDVLARLQDTDKPALIADVGCGVGWASIELAKAFPHIRIDAYDSDEPSIIRARANAAEAGVADRV